MARVCVENTSPLTSIVVGEGEETRVALADSGSGGGAFCRRGLDLRVEVDGGEG